MYGIHEAGVARTTAFVVRIFSAPSWTDQIPARRSEGILTRPTIKPQRSLLGAAKVAQGPPGATSPVACAPRTRATSLSPRPIRGRFWLLNGGAPLHRGVVGTD